MKNLPANVIDWFELTHIQRVPVARAPHRTNVQCSNKALPEQYRVLLSFDKVKFRRWLADQYNSSLKSNRTEPKEKKRARNLFNLFHSFFSSCHLPLCAFVFVIFDSLIIMCGVTSIKNLLTLVQWHSSKETCASVREWNAEYCYGATECWKVGLLWHTHHHLIILSHLW